MCKILYFGHELLYMYQMQYRVIVSCYPFKFKLHANVVTHCDIKIAFSSCTGSISGFCTRKQGFFTGLKRKLTSLRAAVIPHPFQQSFSESIEPKTIEKFLE